MLLLLLFVLLLGWCVNSASVSTVFDTITELVSALDDAAEGDTLYLAAGHYSYNGTVVVKPDGITVAAATSGAAVFVNSFLNIKIKGDGTTLAGFQFINCHAAGNDNLVDVFGNNNRLVDLNFNGCVGDKYVCIRAGSAYNTIESSNFENKVCAV